MAKKSAGMLLYRWHEEGLEVFLVHPGGPFFKNKDEGWWSIPKGEIEEGEDMLACALREMEEESGVIGPQERERYAYLGEVQQKGGKIVHAWALEGDWSGLLICKSWVSIQGRDGQTLKFPEVDKAGFFRVEEARKKMHEAQRIFLERLKQHLALSAS